MASFTEKETRVELAITSRLPEAKPAVKVRQQTPARGKQSRLYFTRLYFTRQPMEEKAICHKSQVRVYICLDLRPGRITGLMFRNRDGVRLLSRLFGSGGAVHVFERQAA